MTREEAKQLMERYHNGTCTKEERILVDSWYAKTMKEEEDMEGEADYDYWKEKIWNGIPMERKSNRQIWMRAAAVLVVISVTAVIYLGRSKKENVILPGGNHATITLADGKVVALDQLKNGQIAALPGLTITKTDAGKVEYHATGSGQPMAANAPLQYNTINVPKGGQYQIVLPDGSKVFLNAASSLRYPVQFAANERAVTLTGEAYFEISKNPNKPFTVGVTNRQRINVIGTHFNVSCYINEPIVTTLAEGAVEISLKDASNKPQTRTLKPGDQSIVSLNNDIRVQRVNPSDALAWKNGFFVFNQTPIRQALAQIARWYDVDVDYNGIPDMLIEGEISRSSTLPDLLNGIQLLTNLKFKQEGRRIAIRQNRP